MRDCERRDYELRTDDFGTTYCGTTKTGTTEGVTTDGGTTYFATTKSYEEHAAQTVWRLLHYRFLWCQPFVVPQHVVAILVVAQRAVRLQ